MANIDITLKTGTHTIAGLKKIPVGNFGDYLNFTIQDSAGTAVNITGLTPKLVLYRAGPLHNMNSVWQKDCSIVSGAAGTCRYQVLNGDFGSRTTYEARIDIYTSTTKVESSQPFLLDVA